MLKINLLPIERQHKDRTPLPRFLLIIASVVIVIGILVWNIHIFLQTRSTQDSLEKCEKELAGLQDKVSDVERLRKEEKQLLTWKKIGESVKNSRLFLWWQKVDVLWDVFEEYPRLWITSFKLTNKSSSQAKAIANITFNCSIFSVGEIDVNGMTNFHRRLKKTPELMDDFNGGVTEPLDFSAKRMSGSSDEKPEWLLKFKIEITKK